MVRTEKSLHDANGRLWVELMDRNTMMQKDLCRVCFADSTLRIVARAERDRTLRNAVSQLTSQRKQAVIKRFGLDGLGRRTLAEVAKEMHISPQRVAQLENAALDDLREKRILVTFLEEC